jgi:hypothetical protein
VGRGVRDGVGRNCPSRVGNNGENISFLEDGRGDFARSGRGAHRDVASTLDAPVASTLDARR